MRRQRAPARRDPGGRLIALVVLAVLLLVRAVDPAPVASARLKLFDLYQRLAPAEAVKWAEGELKKIYET